MRVFTFLLIIGFLVSFSCSDNGKSTNDPNDTFANKENKQSSSNSPVMYCDINGQEWQGSAINGSFIHEQETDLIIVDITGIAPVVEEVDFTTMFNLNIRNFKGIGVYERDVLFGLKRLNRMIDDKKEDRSNNGTIKVTHWDDQTNTISGEFTTLITADDKKEYKISNGQFSQIALSKILVD